MRKEKVAAIMSDRIYRNPDRYRSVVIASTALQTVPFGIEFAAIRTQVANVADDDLKTVTMTASDVTTHHAPLQIFRQPLLL